MSLADRTLLVWLIFQLAGPHTPPDAVVVRVQFLVRADAAQLSFEMRRSWEGNSNVGYADKKLRGLNACRSILGDVPLSVEILEAVVAH
jgi:hypothetical protein